MHTLHSVQSLSNCPEIKSELESGRREGSLTLGDERANIFVDDSVGKNLTGSSFT